MAHYQGEKGQIFGWGPTVEEIDALATIFDEIRHIGCLYQETPPPSALPYQAKNVQLIPVPPTGGNHVRDKFGILAQSPRYLRTIRSQIEWSEAVHVRCPANIPLLAIVLLTFQQESRMRWVKYAGNWRPEKLRPLSYTFQRWWLSQRLHRGVVTVNGKWPDQPRHIFSFINPCLMENDIEQGAQVAERKTLNLPIKLLFVGRVESPKGVDRLLKIARGLSEKSIPYQLDIIGDGPERPNFENWARQQEISNQVQFHGWLPKPTLPRFYQKAHLLVLPTTASEGWPKVLSEAMAFGAVPIAGTVSSIPQILTENQCGVAIPADQIASYIDTIQKFIIQPSTWENFKRKGLEFSPRFTYQAYLQNVIQMFDSAWGVELPRPD